MLSSKVYTLQGSISCIIDLIFLGINNSSYPLVLTNGPLKVDLPAIRMDRFETEQRWMVKYKPNMNIIYVNNSIFLDEFLNKFFVSRFMTSRTRFLFYGNISSDSTSIVQKFYVNDAIFVDLKKDKIFTYYPLRYKNIRKIDKRLVKIGTCDNLKRMPSRITQNYSHYKGWTLKFQNVYCKTESLGLDILMMILDHWRVKYDVICKGGSIVYKRVMENHDLDILVDNSNALDALYSTFSIPFHFDTISIYFLGVKSSSSWNYLLLIFTTSVWLIMAVTLTIISIFWVSLQFALRNRYFSDVFTKILTNLMVYSYLKNTKYCSEIVFIVFFIIFNIFTGAIFEGALFYTGTTHKLSNSTAVSEDPDYRTIAYPSELPYNQKQVISTEKRIECGYLPKCIENALSERYMAIVFFDQMDGRFRQSLENDTVKFFKVDPPLKDIRLALFFAKGHPLVDIYNKYLQLFRENGLLYRVIERYSSIPSDKSEEIHKSHKLKLTHLKAAFFFFVMGMSMGLIIFAIEHITLFKIRMRFVA